MTTIQEKTATILSVADDANQTAIARVLTQAGYRVIGAAAAEALRLAEEEQPDLVVLDGRLSQESRINIVQRLRNNTKTAARPILYLAPAGDSRVIVAGLEAGADVYLADPTDPDVLLATITALLRSHQAERDLRVKVQECDSLVTELAQQQILFDTVLEQMPAGVMIVAAPSGQIVSINERARQITQDAINLADTVGEYLQLQAFHPDGRPLQPEEWPSLRAMQHGEKTISQEIKLVRRDGSQVSLLGSASPLRDPNGNIIAAVVNFQDITELKQTQEQAAWLATFPMLNPNPIIEMDLEGRVSFANPVAEEIFPDLRQQQTAHPWLEDWATIARDFRQGKASVLVRDVAVGARWYQLSIHYVEQTRHIRIYGMEITDRKQAEEARERLLEIEHARAQEARLLDTIQEVTPDWLAYLDRDLRIIRANTICLDSLGVTRDEAISRTFYDLFPNSGDVAQLFEQVRISGEPLKLTEFPHFLSHKPELGTRYFNVSFDPVKNASGEVLGIVVSAQDITTHVKEREQLLEAERARTQLAESLGAEISHRVKNNLTMISGMLQMQALLSPDSRLAVMLNETIARIRTFADIHQQIYEGQAGSVYLLKLLQRVADTTRSIFAAEDGVEILVQGEHLIYPAKSATNIANIANEFITNAIKYGSPGESAMLKVVIKLRKEGDMLRLSVWNSGPPLPADLDISNLQSLGLNLVRDLAITHYNGSFALHREGAGNLAEVTLEEAALLR